jgi:hypothetical protein
MNFCCLVDIVLDSLTFPLDKLQEVPIMNRIRTVKTCVLEMYFFIIEIVIDGFY